MLLLACVCAVLFTTGCTHPSAANNLLRDENQKLREQITDLDRRHVGDEATIKALEQKQGTPLELSSSKVDQLFTVHGIKLGRLTGGDDWDPSKPGQEGLKVAVDPFDEEGDKIKAAGSIVVDAFDLAATPDTQIGHWSFDLHQTRKNWISGGFISGYVLKCEWQKIPKHNDITVKVTFTDALTGRAFTEQKLVKVQPPPTTQSASTQPASQP